MSLEYKRKQLELARVQMGKMDLEFKVEERSAEIEKLKEHIAIQVSKEAELIEELDKLK
jgi:Cu/Ag efflux protein CusF